MKKETKRSLLTAVCLLGAFAAWTAAVCFIDVETIGPQGSTVGFASLNQWVHKLTGVHMRLYHITDWLGLAPIGVALGFAILGLVQWIRRKHLTKVDRSILVLGGFYLAVMAAYLFFENFVVNYRPILIDGCSEASYPSSTTMLVLCVMPTAAMQLRVLIKNKLLKHLVSFAIAAFVIFMVTGRLLSGVHWASDIIGGILLSAGLVSAYRSLSGLSMCGRGDIP